MAIHLYADNACDLDLDYLNSLSVRIISYAGYHQG